MILSQVFQNPSAFRGNFKRHPTAVLGIGSADQQPLLYRTVYQLHCAVVAKAKACGGIGNCDQRALRGSGYLKQQLMLPGMQIDLICRPFTELQEAAQLVSKFRESLKQVMLGLISILR